MKRYTVCQLVKDEEPYRIIFVGEYWQVALSSDQEYLARTYVTLKRHKKALEDLNDDEIKELFEIVRKFEKSVNLEFQPTHFNWSCLMNNAIGDGEEAHVHWHAIPRYKKTQVIGDATFKDPRWPKSTRNLSPRLVSEELLTQIRDRIKSHF